MASRTLLALAGLFALASALPAPPLPKAKDPAAPPPITAAEVAKLRPLEELAVEVRRIVPGPKRGELAFVGWQRPVEVVDAATFRPLRKIAEGRRPIAFAASPDGKRIAWCENDTRVVLQDVAGGKPITLETGNAQPWMAFSPDGKLLATGGYGTEARLWDMAGKSVYRLAAGGKGGLTPVFSPDGKVLAVGNRNDETRLFEVATGKELHVLPRRMTQGLAFHPDGKSLAAAYVNGTVGVWDVATGKLLASTQSGAEEVYTVGWGKKGDILVTAGRAGKIVLWDRRLTRVRELEAPVWVIVAQFTPDGSRLLTSGGADTMGKAERKVVVWGVPEKGEKK